MVSWWAWPLWPTGALTSTPTIPGGVLPSGTAALNTTQPTGRWLAEFASLVYRASSGTLMVVFHSHLPHGSYPLSWKWYDFNNCSSNNLVIRKHMNSDVMLRKLSIFRSRVISELRVSTRMYGVHGDLIWLSFSCVCLTLRPFVCLSVFIFYICHQTFSGLQNGSDLFCTFGPAVAVSKAGFVRPPSFCASCSLVLNSLPESSHIHFESFRLFTNNMWCFLTFCTPHLEIRHVYLAQYSCQSRLGFQQIPRPPFLPCPSLAYLEFYFQVILDVTTHWQTVKDGNRKFVPNVSNFASTWQSW